MLGKKEKKTQRFIRLLAYSPAEQSRTAYNLLTPNLSEVWVGQPLVNAVCLFVGGTEFGGKRYSSTYSTHNVGAKNTLAHTPHTKLGQKNTLAHTPHTKRGQKYSSPHSMQEVRAKNTLAHTPRRRFRQKTLLLTV